MQRRIRWESWAIALLLLIEAMIFSGSFRKFFNHDGLFYIVHAPRNWEQGVALFLSPDSSRQYRPLTLIFLAPFARWWGADPAPYHWIPLLFHLANTWLLYRLVTRLVRSRIIPVAAAAFWGLHSVAAWVAYDITCISDFLSAFLLFSCLILAVDGMASRSFLRLALSCGLFLLSLFTKETATTFPLALLLCLLTAGTRDETAPWRRDGVWRALRRAAPLTALFLGAALAMAGLLIHWFRAGMLYTQGPAAAYDIGPLSNLAGKSRYLFWALNFPDGGGATSGTLVAHLIAGAVVIAWAADLGRRRMRIGAAEWSGIAWFVGLCVPALMLSARLAKWYLYVPLAGVALAFGAFAESMRDFAARRLPGAVAAVPLGLLGLAIAWTSAIQARSYLRTSDAAYVSDSLKARLAQLGELVPSLPRGATLYFPPDFEDVTRLLSAPPLEDGQLFALYYPDRQLRARFAVRGHGLPPNREERERTRVLQYLGGRFYDITRHLHDEQPATLFLLRTPEGQTPPLLDRPPAGGWERYERHVRVAFEDRGARLPDDYQRRSDLWIVQYINGHFYDVTDYYKGRRLHHSRRLADSLDQLRVSVSRREFYPDYERFATPNGRAAFFLTPQKEILTQIGGSTVNVPLGIIPPAGRLRFDVSWMNDTGDGGWAEIRLRFGPEETTLFREYMQPNPRGTGFRWKEVSVDLGRFAGTGAELILRCYNEPGKTTVSDWLNWRDMVIEAGPPALGR